MELGGNITLENFNEIDPGQLIVIKKIVGNYTKKISEKNIDFKKILVSLSKDNGFTIKVRLETSSVVEEEATSNNLFFALDKALSKFV